MEKKRKNKDLWCMNCTEREATHLLYYIKSYPHTGRISIINPSLVCDKCKPLFLGLDKLFIERPVLTPFSTIGKWDHRLMGITSKNKITINGRVENIDFNAMAQPWWVKRLRRVIYIWKDYDGQQRQAI